MVVIDGNCKGWSPKRAEVRAEIREELFPAVVVGVPAPHVERWCIAAPHAYAQIVGREPPADPGKCARDLYKNFLADALAQAGVTVVTDEMEVAPDIVSAMRLHAAARTQPSLGALIDDLRKELRRLKFAAG